MSKSLCRLSVIIPVFNGSKFIEDLLGDVLKLDFPDYEVIVVNDGSTDNTLEILQKYATKYRHIKFINQQNQGVSSARNQGLQKAVGKYIMFLDADDRLDPVICEKFINEAIQEGAQYSFTGYNEQNFRTNKTKVVYSSGQGLYHFNNFMNVFFDNLKTNLISYPINTIYLKSIIDEYEVRFNESIHFAEDLLFNLDYLMHVNKVYISKENYYIYRKYSNRESLSSNFKMHFWYSRKLVYKSLNKLYTVIEDKKNFEVKMNTYAALAMLFTIKQILESEITFGKKLHHIKEVITDDYLNNFINKHLLFTKNQKIILQTIKIGSPLLVFLLYKAYSIKERINNLIR